VVETLLVEGTEVEEEAVISIWLEVERIAAEVSVLEVAEVG